jgi:hypothetical protein
VIRVEGVNADQLVDIVGLRSYDGLSGGLVLVPGDGTYYARTPFTFEVLSRLIGHEQIEFRGGPGAPVLVAASDKFGQTFRARGERIVLWQGSLATSAVSSGHLRTVMAPLTNP